MIDPRAPQFPRPEDRGTQVAPPPGMSFQIPAARRLPSPNEYGRGFVSGALTEVSVPPIPTEANFYAFEMFDASTAIAGAQVRILDGQLFGPNDEGYPSGMPAGDDFTLAIGGDGFEVWVGYTYDESTGLITSRFIDQGAATPANISGTAYVTLGAIAVDLSGPIPVCTPTNFQCGDIIIEVLPTDGLDQSKSWVWGFDTADGNEKWIEICTGNICAA